MDSSQNSEVQKIEWLTQSFVTEWPVLLKILESLNVSSPDSNFIQSQIIVSFSYFNYLSNVLIFY